MFCRFCGKQLLDDSIFCSYCGQKLSTDGVAQGSAFDFSALDSAITKSKEYDAIIAKARALVITGNYTQALEIYDKMIEDDPADVNGYIGILRVASHNYTNFNGTYNYKNTRTGTYMYLNVASEMDIVSKLLGAGTSCDSEYNNFCKRYNDYKAEQESIRQKQEQERLAEAERKKREAEEAEKRKPQQMKAAIAEGDKALQEQKYQDAFNKYAEALSLASYLKAELPADFCKKFGEACSHDTKSARNSTLIMEYFTNRANTNDATAQYYLGYIYMWGKSSYTYDYSYGEYRYSNPESFEAERWFNKAASNGSAEAMYYFGKRIYENAGKNNGYGCDEKEKQEEYLKSFYWLKKAMDLGHYGATAIVAHMYNHGYGVARDVAKALELYKKVNDPLNIALIYRYSYNNLNEAIFWYKKAGSNLDIAQIYESLGNKSEAITYYRKCVENTDYPSDEAVKALSRLLYK